MRISWQLELTMRAKRETNLFSYQHTWQAEEPAPPNLLRDLLVLTEIEQIPTILETDANAHHTYGDSSDINPRGKDLLAYCASAEADINEFSTIQSIRARRALSCTATERLESTERILPCHFSRILPCHFFKHALDTAMFPLAWKEGTGIFLPKLRKESPYDHINFVSTEMVGKASSVSY